MNPIVCHKIFGSKNTLFGSNKPCTRKLALSKSNIAPNIIHTNYALIYSATIHYSLQGSTFKTLKIIFHDNFQNHIPPFYFRKSHCTPHHLSDKWILHIERITGRNAISSNYTWEILEVNWTLTIQTKQKNYKVFFLFLKGKRCVKKNWKAGINVPQIHWDHALSLPPLLYFFTFQNRETTLVQRDNSCS